MSQEKSRKYLAMGALLLVTIVWGWGFVFANMGLEAGISPAGIMSGRFTLAALLLGCVFRKTIRAHYQKGQWKKGLVAGSCLFLAFYTQTLGLERSTPSNNAFITGAYVVMVPFIWWLISKKRPAPVIFLSCVLSLLGVTALSLDPSEGFRINPGDILTLLSAFFFALQIVCTSLFTRELHYLVLVFMQFLAASVLSLFVFLVGGSGISEFAGMRGLLSILFLSVFSTFFCYLLQTWAQRFVSSSRAGIIMGMEALFGTLFSIMMGYDYLNIRMIFGGLLMLASIILPELFNEQKNR